MNTGTEKLNSEIETQPPQDGRRWFPTHLARIAGSGKASFLTPQLVYDADRGMGRLSPGRMFFSWDSGYDPRDDMPPARLVDLRTARR